MRAVAWLLSFWVMLAGAIVFPTATRAATVLSPPDVSGEIASRLERIVGAMEKVRFCANESCFYRNITATIAPPAYPHDPLTATVTARIDRPAATLDAGDYHFEFRDGRWRLLRGEEYTDVADFVFDGDRYEIFSVHSSRTFKGTLDPARTDSNIRAGYLPLYFEILDRGVERL